MLSFEHVPPRASFNSTPVEVISGLDAIGNDVDLANLRGRVRQRGFGEFTLCPACNSKTGSWYGAAYASWAARAAEIIMRSGGTPSPAVQYRIHPLRVVKQILCMFCSANDPVFVERVPDLRRFLLSRTQIGLHPSVRIFAYYNPTNRMRNIGVAARLSAPGGSVELLSEVSAYPLGYLLTIDDSTVDPKLVDLTFFAKCGYDEKREMWLNIPAKHVYTAFPGDYRSPEEVNQDVIRNQTAPPTVY